MKYYRLKQDEWKTSPIVDYTFDKDKEAIFMKLTDLPMQIQTPTSKTEFDLAKNWCDFAKQSIGKVEYAESEMPCWDGHYQQFGRVMLELMRLSRDKSKLDKSRVFYEMVPNIEDFTFIGEPSGTEDRTFYRLWFSYIGHPSFTYPRIQNIEAETYAYWGYLIEIATAKINRTLWSKKGK